MAKKQIITGSFRFSGSRSMQRAAGSRVQRMATLIQAERRPQNSPCCFSGIRSASHENHGGLAIAPRKVAAAVKIMRATPACGMPKRQSRSAVSMPAKRRPRSAKTHRNHSSLRCPSCLVSPADITSVSSIHDPRALIMPHSNLVMPILLPKYTRNTPAMSVAQTFAMAPV